MGSADRIHVTLVEMVGRVEQLDAHRGGQAAKTRADASPTDVDSDVASAGRPVMRNILTKTNLATLTDFASSSVLLAFDYDGTLAPIAPNPADARMRATTRQLLTRVARIYPSVVISGRAHHDLAKRLGRLPLWEVFGNHGAEP